MNIGRRWLAAAACVGAFYCGVSLLASALGGAAASGPIRIAWRWSAFVLSGVAFAGHIADERLRHRSGARRTAWHTCVGVALGAFGLALAANVHDVGSASGYRPRMLVALVAWPLLTAAPAFVVALVVATGLGTKPPQA